MYFIKNCTCTSSPIQLLYFLHVLYCTLHVCAMHTYYHTCYNSFTFLKNTRYIHIPTVKNSRNHVQATLHLNKATSQADILIFNSYFVHVQSTAGLFLLLIWYNEPTALHSGAHCFVHRY